MPTWKAGAGSWSVKQNWDTHVPLNGEAVIINSGNPYIATGAVAQTLNIARGATVDISGQQAGATGSLIMGGDIITAGQLNLNGGPDNATLGFFPTAQLDAA